MTPGKNKQTNTLSGRIDATNRNIIRDICVSRARLRVEHMERQLANLTGLVAKALTQTVPTSSPRERDLSVSSGSVHSHLELCSRVYFSNTFHRFSPGVHSACIKFISCLTGILLR